MPVEQMPGTTPPSMTTQEAAIIDTGAIRKKVTTIFVKKKAVAKQKVTLVTTNATKDATNKKVVPTQAVEVTTSDEELLEATVAIELEEDRKMKEIADSDEELLQAAEALETLQLHDAKDGFENNISKEDHHRDSGQADHDSGQGDHPLQQGDVKSTPTSPTSPTRTRTSPPGSPTTPRPSSASGARLTCTPLWKKKSLERRMSSSQGKKKAAKRTSLLSQKRSPADTRASATVVSPASASESSISKYQMFRNPENARPGQELPRKSMIIMQPLYAQDQLAKTSDNPKDETKFPDQSNGRKAWYEMK